MNAVTYSPQDDKLRVYFLSRQSDEVLAPLRDAGFRWAGAQECWFATWSPSRLDAALAAAGVDDVDDEPSTLEDRAEDRAARFEGYAENAKAEAERMDKRDRALTEAMAGQPILVGHHSEKRHRRDYERMWQAMRKAAEGRKRGEYWATRATASVRWANYKEQPGVRARRIKTLEAELRAWQRSLADAELGLRLFVETMPFKAALAAANGLRIVPYGTWGRLDSVREADDATKAARLLEVVTDVRHLLAGNRGNSHRWIAHLEGRIAYERAQLAAQGAESLLAPKPRKVQPPIRNTDSPGAFRMTKAEYAAIWRDCKGCRTEKDADGTAYRYRVAMVKGSLGRVFLTDVGAS